MDKITKLPWRLEVEEMACLPEEGWKIIAADGTELLNSEKYYPSVPEKLDDWKYICRAVNSHEGLVNALEKGRLLAKEAGGFIRCHELALSSDGGNSNMAVMEIRIKEFEEALKNADGE